ncbi:hypothetical protein [Calothrix sp. 336/3]|nr:hypothetical protein IJ00_05845 [Calothrix sp. 336/3]
MGAVAVSAELSSIAITPITITPAYAQNLLLSQSQILPGNVVRPEIIPGALKVSSPTVIPENLYKVKVIYRMSVRTNTRLRKVIIVANFQFPNGQTHKVTRELTNNPGAQGITDIILPGVRAEAGIIPRVSVTADGELVRLGR